VSRGSAVRQTIAHPGEVFYGWRIVGVGLVVQALIGVFLMQSFGAYVAVLRADFGWSKTTFSLAFSMTRVESGLLGPLQGWMIDRYGPRNMMRLGLIMFAVGLMLFSQIDATWNFFLIFFLMAVGTSLAGFMTLTTAVVHWFERRRAMAIAVMGLGIAIGGLLVPVIVVSFEEFGWRNTAFVSGWIVLAVGMPLSVVVHTRPEDKGLTVDGIPETAPPAELKQGRPSNVSSITGVRDYTLTEALRTPAFWYISLGHAAALLVVSAVMVHLVVHVNENLGYSLGTAALVVSLMTAMQIVGMLIGGILGDRIDKRAIVVAAMLFHMVGLLLLAWATALWMVIVFAVLHGMGWGMRGPLMQAIRADYFGRTSFAKIMGVSSMIVMLGMTAGPIVAGVLAEATGNYQTGFTILAILAGAGSIFFVLARPPKHPDEPREERKSREQSLEELARHRPPQASDLTRSAHPGSAGAPASS